MKVSEVMNPNVVTIPSDAAIRDCVKMLRENKVSGVPVIDGDKLVGIITERDILKLLKIPEHGGYWLPSPLEVIEVPIRDVIEWLELRSSISEDVGNWSVERAMTKPVHTVNANADIEEASELMVRHGINRLPVVDTTGRLVGIVTRGDIVKGIAGTR
jgi:CBS domain-containing protein